MKPAVRWLAALALFLGLFVVSAPAAPARAQEQRCFAETGQCIAGRIRAFWEANGGLMTFGYPITEQRAEPIEGRAYQVQWFERARLELHPENPAPYDVLLGRLGVDRLAQQGRDWTAFPKSPPGTRNDCTYFETTGHFVCAAFRFGWASRGLEIDGVPGYSFAESMALLGLPLDDARVEVIDGKQLQVQWFERGRLEFHPDNSPPYNILGGLLGREILQNQRPEPVPEPAGHIIYLAPDGVTVTRINPDGSAPQSVLTIAKQQSETVFRLSANPAGTAILYGVYSDAGGAQYWLAKGGNARRVGAFATAPRWSPSGNAFVAQGYGEGSQEGSVSLYDVATDLNVTLPIRGTPDWFPDSRRLVYVEHGIAASGMIAGNLRVYDVGARTSTPLTALPTSGPDTWAIQEAHVLPGGEQVIFYGGQVKNLGASGNGQQWWWVPAAGGQPQRFSEPIGNGVAAYAASPSGEWVAAATQMHVSACASEGSLLLQTSDVRGGVAAQAPLPLADQDSYLVFNGLGWEPNSNYLAFGAQSYRCANAASGREAVSDAIYVWKIRLLNQSGATLIKVADGSLPVWVQ